MSEEHGEFVKEEYRSDPEAYGIDLDALDTTKRAQWHRQEAFLGAYAGRGTITSTAARVGLTKQVVYLWKDDNALKFTERFEDAHNHFTDILEDKAWSLALATKPGQSPLMLIAMLNANLPEKYKHNVVQVDQTAKEVMTKLQGLQKQANASPTPSEGPQNEPKLDITRKNTG